MSFVYGLGKLLFCLALVINAYLIFLNPYFKKDFE